MTRLPIVALLVLAAPSTAAAQSKAWWGHINVLAHDSMRGRETGSPEHRRAAEYVARAFQRAGLEPAGTDGWFQPVRFQVRRIAEDRSRLALVRDGRTEPLALGTDATINVRGSGTGSVDAPLVFAGYGMRAPEYGLDDFAELDVRGKMVVVLAGVAPEGIPGPAVAAARSAGADAIQAGGAAGVISIFNPHGDLPWSRYALSRLQPQMRLASDSAPAGPVLLSVVLNPDRAERLFAGSPHRYAALRALADSGAPLPRFALPGRLRATAALREDTAISDNVIGLLPGSDPALKGEYLVLTAHLDHLGVGDPVDGDSIYNGAMDNASGIATLVETAGTLARRMPRLRRPVLFVAVTAEEKGLLGSDYFAGHPTIPSGALVANLNTDMFLPINPLRRLLVNGLEESDLSDDVRRAAGRLDVEVITDPEPERNGFVRSDQFSFIRRGIPALSLKVGFTRESPEHERVLKWRQDRYHGMEDEVGQPVNLQAAAEFNRLYAEVVTEIANRPTRPAWYPTSAFKPEAEGTE
ncbi:MAG: M28 family peptidase [Gemmatimonadales bacterium]|nr:M28 family peptidase [Gemmatimonadales bacterium]MBA3556870.1 M28 family peptidase [Gemmatimonadales bacterium]